MRFVVKGWAMECKQVLKLLNEYVDDSLSWREAESMERHLASCSELCTRVAGAEIAAAGDAFAWVDEKHLRVLICE